MTQSPRNAFIVSKPIQLMVSMAIARQLEIEEQSDFLIVGSFAGAKDVAERLTTSGAQGVRIFNTHKEAYAHAGSTRPKTLFIDSDIGLSKYLTLAAIKLKSPKTSVHVFEEGIGTYRDDLYSGAKRKLFNFLGVGTVFGGSAWVSQIHVFDPALYSARTGGRGAPARQISPAIAEFIDANSKQLDFLFDTYEPPSVPACNVYLSGWEIDSSLVSDLLKESLPLLIKPHPHIKTPPHIQGAEIVPASYPAEMLLGRLTQTSGSVTVYHHGSSVAEYMKGSGPSFVSRPFQAST